MGTHGTIPGLIVSHAMNVGSCQVARIAWQGQSFYASLCHNSFFLHLVFETGSNFTAGERGARQMAARIGSTFSSSNVYADRAEDIHFEVEAPVWPMGVVGKFDVA